MSDSRNEEVGLFFFGLLYILQLITYVMAIAKWFMTEHQYFWTGFKELIWALVPIVNFTYVWDWWVIAFILVQHFIQQKLSY